MGTSPIRAKPNLARSSQPDFRQAGFIVEVLFWPNTHDSAVGVSVDSARPQDAFYTDRQRRLLCWTCSTNMDHAALRRARYGLDLYRTHPMHAPHAVLAMAWPRDRPLRNSGHSADCNRDGGFACLRRSRTCTN